METQNYTFSANKYITRGISLEVPLPLQLLMWTLIMDLPCERDYLQVFELSVSQGKQKVIHKQECPEYQREYILLADEKCVTAKIFVIDDIEVCTMLLAEEY
jgi:hypothetical protein